MKTSADWIYSVGYEAELKQKLASIAGIGDHNLTDYTIYQLIKEVERFKLDLYYVGSQLVLNPTVQEAYLYLYNQEARN